MSRLRDQCSINSAGPTLADCGSRRVGDVDLDEIRRAMLIVFAAIGRNPNDFYEAGYAVTDDYVTGPSWFSICGFFGASGRSLPHVRVYG